MSALTTLERGAIVAAVRHMCRADWHFDICTFDEACKLLGVSPTDRERSALRLLHCVKWAAMDAATRDEVLALMGRLFGPMEAAPESAPVLGLFRRFLPGGAR